MLPSFPDRTAVSWLVVCLRGWTGDSFSILPRIIFSTFRLFFFFFLWAEVPNINFHVFQISSWNEAIGKAVPRVLESSKTCAGCWVVSCLPINDGRTVNVWGFSIQEQRCVYFFNFSKLTSSRCVGDERNFPPLSLPLLLPAVLVLDLKLAVPNILLPEAIERTMAFSIPCTEDKSCCTGSPHIGQKECRSLLPIYFLGVCPALPPKVKAFLMVISFDSDL